MGLPLRITFDDTDFVYEIVNSKAIKPATEFEIVLNGDKVELIRDDKMVWVLKDGNKDIDPALIQALGRSVSLRLRL
jgi:hypothetical protein